MTMFKNFLKDESGASAAEYAIIVAVVGAALVASLALLTGGINTAMTTAKTALETGSTPAS